MSSKKQVHGKTQQKEVQERSLERNHSCFQILEEEIKFLCMAFRE